TCTGRISLLKVATDSRLGLLEMESVRDHLYGVGVTEVNDRLVGPHTYGESWPQGTLWPPPQYDIAWDLDWSTSRVHPYLPSPFDYGIPPVTGRLGQTIEGGGKRRIFAMGNYVNLNQRLLKPVHDWLMQVLRRIPMDGTFAFTKLRWNQHKPLDRLVGNQTCYSFDLKSATDRWPVLFLFE
ncbi:hypothetical protein HN51_059283, partial [Arachis hypogaea]